MTMLKKLWPFKYLIPHVVQVYYETGDTKTFFAIRKFSIIDGWEYLDETCYGGHSTWNSWTWSSTVSGGREFSTMESALDTLKLVTEDSAPKFRFARWE